MRWPIAYLAGSLALLASAWATFQTLEGGEFTLGTEALVLVLILVILAIGSPASLPAPGRGLGSVLPAAMALVTLSLHWHGKVMGMASLLVLGSSAGLLWWALTGNGRARSAEQRREALLTGQVAFFGWVLVLGAIGLSRTPHPGLNAVWFGLVAAYPVCLLQRQLAAITPPADRPSAFPVARTATALLLVATLTVLVLAITPPGTGGPAGGTTEGNDPTYGYPEPGDGDPSSLTYRGSLDTSTRAELADTEVLRVRADRPDHWRATSFDRWDGRRWTRSSRPIHLVEAQEVDGETALQYLPTSGVAPGAVVEHEQTFRVQAGFHDLLYGAATPVTAETPGLTVIVESDDTLRTSPVMGRGTQWTVTSRRAEVTAEDLRALGSTATSGAVTDDGGRAGPGAETLGIPASVPDRVLDLAAEVTAGAATTYDRVTAIEDWLAANIEYTELPPLPDEGEDAVDRTLFVDRVGSCDQIASAFVLMARAVGIPARVAVGYTPDRFEPATGEYVVLASNAHAWAEVWFGPAGWIPFDPTTDIPLAGEPAPDRPSHRPLALGLAALTALLLAGAALLRLGRRLVRWRTEARDPKRALRSTVAAFERTLRLRTRARRPGETIIGYAGAVTPPPWRESSLALAEALTAASFQPAPADTDPLRRQLRDLQAEWHLALPRRLVRRLTRRAHRLRPA